MLINVAAVKVLVRNLHPNPNVRVTREFLDKLNRAVVTKVTDAAIIPSNRKSMRDL